MKKLRARMVRKLCQWTACGPRGPHITRYSMYKHLTAMMAPLAKGGPVLTIGESADFAARLGLTGPVTEANYPAVSMTNLPYPDNMFDYVVSDQVLEHVEGDPFQAVAESRRVLRPDGIAVHTTCLINPIHGVPKDFWRFTPDALRLLCHDFAEVIDIGGWGNLEAWVWIQAGFRWEGVPEAHWHPLHKVAIKNNPKYPISTWVAARK